MASCTFKAADTIIAMPRATVAISDNEYLQISTTIAKANKAIPKIKSFLLYLSMKLQNKERFQLNKIQEIFPETCFSSET